MLEIFILHIAPALRVCPCQNTHTEPCIKDFPNHYCFFMSYALRFLRNIPYCLLWRSIKQTAFYPLTVID